MKGAHVQNACNCQCAVCWQDRAIEQDICQAHTNSYKEMTTLWEDFVCLKGEFEEWHKLNYLMGDCVQCGANQLAICCHECSVGGSREVAWRCFEQNTIGVTYENKPKKNGGLLARWMDGFTIVEVKDIIPIIGKWEQFSKSETSIFQEL